MAASSTYRRLQPPLCQPNAPAQPPIVKSAARITSHTSMHLTITKAYNGLITIKDETGRKCTYMYYNKRDAVRKFREDYGLVGKKLIIITV